MSLEQRTAGQDASLQPAPEAKGLGVWRSLDPYMLALIIVLAVQLALIFGRPAPALEGQLNSTDDYMRLVRVTQLMESGAWFDGAISRAAQPEGMTLHWTRPMDLILLAGAALLSPLLGLEAGLLWTGILISPLLYLGVVLALVWAAAPLLDRGAHSLLTLAAVAQGPLLMTSAVGGADHHMLINLAFVVGIGLLLRALRDPASRRRTFAAGAALGFALWLTMEALGLLLAGLATLTLAWLAVGPGQARCNLWHGIGLCAMVALALAVERPPSDYMTAEYDRISIVHLVIALMALAFWACSLGIERWRGGGVHWSHRLALGALGAALAGLTLWLSFPDFFGGPEVAVDPNLRPVFHDLVAEMKPLLPDSQVGLSRFLIHLGAAPLVVPYLAWRLWAAPRTPAWWGWFHLAICLAVYLPLALAMRRFSPFAGLLLALPLAALIGLVMTKAGALSFERLRLPLQYGALLLLLGGLPAAGVLLKVPGMAKPVGTGVRCLLRSAVAPLNDPRGLGDRPRQILAHIDHGPELLYRTRHKVVAVPYHRNAASILDSDRFFGARDDDAARAIAQQRSIDLVMLCPGGPAQRQAALHGANTLAARLLDGRGPIWLARVDPATAPAGGFLIYRVNTKDR